MVTLDRIYTRGGDQGETSLGDGERVAKDSPRIEAIGAVNEANAAIGLARLHTAGEPDVLLARIQNDLFDLGADLATPEDGRKGANALRVTDAQVERLEREIDRMNAALQPLKSFILPGGSPASAHIHFASTVVRRAERLMVALKRDEPVGGAALRYINRLSDHLFVLARHLNDRGASDVLWTPGANR
ncbi:MAG: cob(I)yrinic acid a,c-diamide adenosyltransferase [Rhodospirillales bacterium]|jgi:cob(I)alamin adenosyltransferase|nr:cob(I)yrinic acid a,c-diamide adenosyltransferase [Rhodospirillales bacterium]